MQSRMSGFFGRSSKNYLNCCSWIFGSFDYGSIDVSLYLSGDQLNYPYCMHSIVNSFSIYSPQTLEPTSVSLFLK